MMALGQNYEDYFMSLFSGSGALNFGRSSTKSKSESSMDQNVFGPQADALQKMYGFLSEAYGDSGFSADKLQQLAPQLSSLFSGYANDAGGAYKQQLGGGSFGDTGDIRSLLSKSFENTMRGSNTGDMYESIVGGPGNTYIDPMVAAMKGSALENMKTIQSSNGLDATVMGQSGSSRHAMQNAITSRLMNKDMLDREMAMRGGAYDTDLNRKLEIAKLADTNQLQTQRNMMDTLSASDQNRQAGINAGSVIQNLGMGVMAPWMQAMNAPWMNMSNYAGVIGDPTVLTNAKSSGSSSGKSLNLGMSGSMGFL